MKKKLVSIVITLAAAVGSFALAYPGTISGGGLSASVTNVTASYPGTISGGGL